jgi:hypothetical protein
MVSSNKYYPDLYLKSKNLIIEVKSQYTYNIDLGKNLLKEKASLDLGINFQFMIVEKIDYNNWKKKQNKK